MLSVKYVKLFLTLVLGKATLEEAEEAGPEDTHVDSDSSSGCLLAYAINFTDILFSSKHQVNQVDRKHYRHK